MSNGVALSLPANYRLYDLPWSRVGEETQRLKKTFLVIAGTALFLSAAVPLLPSSDIVHNNGADVPPRLAKLLIERKAPPPPPPPVVEPEPEPEPEEVAELPKEPEKVPEPEPIPEPEPPKPEPKVAFVPEPEIAPPPPVNEAREKAAKAGLMAMADELAELRDTSSIDSALSNRSLSNAVDAAERTERSLVTSASGRASGGINTAEFSRNTGGGGLAGREVTQVTSPVAGAGGRGGSGGRADGSNDTGIGAGGAGQRSRDQIEMIFDRNKASIYALYRRALRSDPSLQGKLVLELTISGSGEVLNCRVVSSELNAPEFEAKLVQRVRLFKFGSQDVGTITTTKPIDFFPV
ncbi:MAG: AgmX/PglI C-terminal domain-containing protein [Gammaproteobacteria bacterium]